MNTLARLSYVLILLVGGFLAAPQVSAATATVTVDGTMYTLSTRSIPYDGNEALFQSQPWWGDPVLAAAITTALGYQLGDYIGGTNHDDPSAPLGYAFDSGFVSVTFTEEGSTKDCPNTCPESFEPYYYVFVDNAVRTNAVPASTLWSLMLLPVLLGFAGWTRLGRH